MQTPVRSTARIGAVRIQDKLGRDLAKILLLWPACPECKCRWIGQQYHYVGCTLRGRLGDVSQ